MSRPPASFDLSTPGKFGTGHRPSFNRPYDVAIPSSVLKLVRERRKHPTGERRPVRLSPTGNLSYPYDKLKLGDFFITPIGGRSVKSMLIQFYQAAARRDWEIVVAPVFDRGKPAIRVTLTIAGVAAFKHAAELRGDTTIRNWSDGKWTDRVRKSRKRRAAPPTQISPASPRPSVSDKLSDPFWRDKEDADQPLPDVQPEHVPPDVHVTREDILKRHGISRS